jgi:hypothetical protein
MTNDKNQDKGVGKVFFFALTLTFT